MQYFSFVNRELGASTPQRYANNACFRRWGRHHVSGRVHCRHSRRSRHRHHVRLGRLTRGGTPRTTLKGGWLLQSAGGRGTLMQKFGFLFFLRVLNLDLKKN